MINQHSMEVKGKINLHSLMHLKVEQIWPPCFNHFVFQALGEVQVGPA